MAHSTGRASVLAGDLTGALLSVLPGAANRTAPTSNSRVTLRLAPKGGFAIERQGRRATAPLRTVSGTWFDGVSVDGHALALVGRLFQPMQAVELIVGRLEVVVGGPGFRLCIKRLPAQDVTHSRRDAG